MEEKKTRTAGDGKSGSGVPRTAAKKSPKKTGAAKSSAPRRTKKQQGGMIFALDIGTRTVVGILAQKDGDGYKLIDMETREHESRSMTDGQIEDIDAVAAVVKAVRSELEKRQSVKLQRVCVAAAGRALRTLRHKSGYDVSAKRVISAEDIRAAELEAVRSAEEQFTGENANSSFYCVGHSVISLELDGYKVSKPEGHRGNVLATEVIAAFLPAYVVESLCAAVDAAGLETAGLTLEPIAAINAVVPKELRLINIVMCDIGAGTSDVAASRDGSIVAYGMATVAGDEITESLMKQLLVDFNEAERIKTSPDPQTEYTDILFMKHTITAEQVAELLRPAAEQLAQAIADEILSANGGAPQAVFLVGGGSRLAGLPELVAQRLGMPPQRVAAGTREMIRGISVPKNVVIGAEHATPIGIAITSSDGVKYDFTTITLNGRKIRALDTRRLTVFELCSLGGIKPEQLMARSGKALGFTLDGERQLLRGTPSVQAEMTLNGKPCSLNTQVRKGDEVCVTPAIPGEDAASLLSDHYDMAGMFTAEITADGKRILAGDYLLVNGSPVTADADIENGSTIIHIRRGTYADILAELGIDPALALLDGAAVELSAVPQEGDEITVAAPAPAAPKTDAPPQTETAGAPAAENGIPIVFNGIPAEFPAKPGQSPIFLDILAAFADDPTELLAHSATVTINGRTARLDEVIHSGDEIVIE